MNPPALRLQAVTKRYGLQPALDRVDLAVERGEFFGLVGLNGAGKTTLIKGLLDFCDLDGGIAEIFGISHLRTESRRGLAFLPERFTPPYFLTGRDFLRYMLRLHGVPFSPPRVAQVLAELDLEPAALQKPVRDFSKGMSQKLGLAACLLSDRDLLVLDEPMSGLDPKARALLKRRLLALKDGRHSLFFSTHFLADVEALCDRMGILHAGRLRFVGPPHECRERFQADDLEQAFLRCIGEEVRSEGKEIPMK